MARQPDIWHLVTGEYPPQTGGVSDYTKQLATALVQAGREVHVWCPESDVCQEATAGVVAHPIPGGFTATGRQYLTEAFKKFPGQRTILVQYAPNAFGFKGMNVPFCRWLLSRARRDQDDIRVMFHEPYFYFSWQRPWRNMLAVTQRLMAAILLAASSNVYVSTSSWTQYLQPYRFGRSDKDIALLPIPSTIPADPPAQDVARIRKRMASDDDLIVVGHFGTFGDSNLLYSIFADLLADERVVLNLVGGKSDSFRDSLLRQLGSCDRIFATGFVTGDSVASHLRACDVLVQPYRDGVTTRRTSVMAGLRLGVPTITNLGSHTEATWLESGVPLAKSFQAGDMTDLAWECINNPETRANAGYLGRDHYNLHFSLEATIRILLPHFTG